MMAVSATAGAVTLPPLPPNGLMNLDAQGAFAEIFLEVTGQNAFGLAPGMYNDVAIGYTLDDGSGSANFVLYTGASSSTGANPVAPGTIIYIDGTLGTTIGDIFEGNVAGITGGHLYVGGIVDDIETPGGGVEYAEDAASSDWQLSFSLYNTYVQGMTMTIAAERIDTEWILVADEGKQLQFDVWADATADATLGNTVAPAGGTRYLGEPTAGTPDGSVIHELPVRDEAVDTNAVPGGDLLVSLSDGTYYDRFGSGWPELAFAGDPADDDYVLWSFVGNPDSIFTVRETFNLGGAETFIDAATGVLVYISGPSSIMDPFVSGFGLVGQLIPGVSLAPGGKTDGGVGWGNKYLFGEYQITADFRFGAENTGAWDSDYNTFTFQQGEPGSVGTLTQLKGMILIPEPLTMLGVFMGVGGIAGYIRKRRLA